MSEVAKLGIDNPLAQQMASTALPELFVINLCASMTPMPAVPKNLKGFEKYKLYQVSRQEDGRRRFRLRLGFFTNETDAEWVLNSVRSLYPAAFTGCVTQEDLRYTTETPVAKAVASVRSTPALQPAPAAQVAAPNAPAPKVAAKAAVPTTPAAKPAPVAAAPIPKVTPPVTATPKPAPAVKTEAKPAVKPVKTDLILEAAQIPAPKAEARAPASNSQPFHVARGVNVPETNLELTDEYEMLPASAATLAETMVPNAVPAKAAPAAPSSPARPATTATGNPVIRGAHIVNPPKVVDNYVPILDTTLTIRTLTKTEAEDPNRPKWFVVQLALSEQPINLDTMPKLDIFAAYGLYSVAMMEEGGIKHALRLGFFKENVSAEAVMGYLKAFFTTPVITQISTAEYDRFAEPKPKPKVEAEAKVVNLNEKRPVPIVSTTPATTTARVAVKSVSSAVKPAAKSAAKADNSKARMAPPRPQSFLSRLIGRQLD